MDILGEVNLNERFARFRYIYTSLTEREVAIPNSSENEEKEEEEILTVEKLPSPITLPKIKSFGVRLCVSGFTVVSEGFVGTRGAKVAAGATTPLVTSFVGGDILDTGPSTVTAGCGETVSAWFATRCNKKSVFLWRNFRGTLVDSNELE